MFRKLINSARQDPYVALLHVGTACGLIGFACTDPLYLRIGSNISEAAAIAFNVTRLPFPIWTPVYWSGAFMTVNTFNIVTLLNDRRDIVLNPEEEILFNRTFKKSGMRPTQFRRLMAAGTEVKFKNNETIFQEGEISKTVYLLKTGAVLISVRGEHVATVDAKDIGAFIGEMQLLETFGDHSTVHQHMQSNPNSSSTSTGNASTGVYPGKTGVLKLGKDENIVDGEHRKHNTVRVTEEEGATAVAWDLDYLLQILEEQDELAAALRSVLLSTLLKKLRRSSLHDSHVDTYYCNQLKKYTSSGALSPTDRENLQKLAVDHCVSVRFHCQCLSEIGWSEKEFALGAKSADTKKREQTK